MPSARLSASASSAHLPASRWPPSCLPVARLHVAASGPSARLPVAASACLPASRWPPPCLPVAASPPPRVPVAASTPFARLPASRWPPPRLSTSPPLPSTSVRNKGVDKIVGYAFNSIFDHVCCSNFVWFHIMHLSSNPWNVI
ncbi:hypothetical protein GUJ93_ZPchr0006g42377 [Zizania palustris]|uniref:Uncharacterized protein n=1 Tax=Zizania palustris TaxID=103762 RepID=A0A8J5SM73_ZIZPA|nr:hypothetical protein GUJ93_ZPchr0006g42377 [Zizania palustris]